jgi:hypothetical protein
MVVNANESAGAGQSQRDGAANTDTAAGDESDTACKIVRIHPAIIGTGQGDWGLPERWERTDKL